jgi:hypothetical protein
VSDVRENLVAILRRAAERLRGEGSLGDMAERMEWLAGGVHQPCVVAVAGRVKAGKSTFVNALLGEDLAKVGTTETTATINYFTFGEPDAERPVWCHWRGGKVTDESREFLDSLQGNDIETLRRADGVAYLEYFLPNPLLKQITLVDTPGTGAVVEEHVDRTSEFMRLNAELRERHDEETRRLGDTADAVIYLVGQVARVTDQAFLREFAETTGGGSSALNAIGVLSKIELQPEVMSRRHELSAKIATQLEDTLNTVIPVAAGVHREMAGLKSGDRAELRRIVSTLRRIPPDALDMLLTSEEFFCDFDLPDSPVPPEERRGLVGSMKWAVFTTIARVAADGALSLDGVEARLEEMSGFGPLWDVLHRHFIERGHVLRCRRITADAREALGDIRYIHLPRLRKEARNEKARLERFLAFINRSGGDSETALELEGFVRERLDVDARLRGVEALHAELDAELGGLLVELVEYTEDFEALQKLEASDEAFTAADLAELRPLLGLYGGEVGKRLPPGAANAEYVGWRQMHWGKVAAESASDTVEHSVAERAYTRYGLILDEILSVSGIGEFG